MKPNDIIIDPEIKALIPPLREEERTLLEESLHAEGCRDPLVVWEGHNILLDGHNRKEICDRLRLEYAVTELALPDREAACDWVDANQLGRRNLTPDQMSLLRGRRYNRRKTAHGGSRNSRGQNVPLKKTSEKLAEEHGVTDRTIKRDGQFASAVDRATAIDPDLPSRIATGDAPFRQTIIKAADTAKSDPDKARSLLKKTKAEEMKEKREGKATPSEKPVGKFDTGPRYLAILMAVSRELSRIQRFDLSKAEKADFRAKVMNCLEDQLRRTK